MESPSLCVENNDYLHEQSKTSRIKAQNSVLTYISNPKRERTMLGSSFAQQNNKASQSKGQFVISYNFDHNQIGKAITHNIFIGWDDEPTKKSIKKPKQPNGGLHSKTPIKNKMILENRIINEQLQKQNDAEETIRINQARKKQNQSLSKLPACKRTTEHSYVSNRGQSMNRTKIKQTYVPAIDRKLNRDKQSCYLQSINNPNRNSSCNVIRPIANPIQNTERKKENGQELEQRKTIGKKQVQDNIQNKLKLPSFQTSRQSNSQFRIGRANKNQQNKQEYRNGKTIGGKKNQNNNQNEKHANKQNKIVKDKKQDNLKDQKIFNNADSLLWKQEKQKSFQNIGKQAENNEYGADTMKLIQQLQKMESQITEQNQISQFQNNDLDQTYVDKKSKVRVKKQNEQHIKENKNKQNPNISKTKLNQIQDNRNIQKNNIKNLKQKQLSIHKDKDKDKNHKNLFQNSSNKKKVNQSRVGPSLNKNKQVNQNLNQRENQIHKSINNGNYNAKQKIAKKTDLKQNKHQIREKVNEKKQDHLLKENKKEKTNEYIKKQQQFSSSDGPKKQQNQENTILKDSIEQQKQYVEKQDQKKKDEMLSIKEKQINQGIKNNQGCKLQRKQKEMQMPSCQVNALKNSKGNQQISKQIKQMGKQLGNDLEFKRKSVAKKSINSYMVNIESIKDEIGKQQDNYKLSKYQEQQKQKENQKQNVLQQTKNRNILQNIPEEKHTGQKEQKQKSEKANQEQNSNNKIRKVQKVFDIKIAQRRNQEKHEKKNRNKGQIKHKTTQKKLKAQQKSSNSNQVKQNGQKNIKKQIEMDKEPNKKQIANFEENKCFDNKNNQKILPQQDHQNELKKLQNSLIQRQNVNGNKQFQQIKAQSKILDKQKVLLKKDLDQFQSLQQQHQELINEKQKVEIPQKDESDQKESKQSSSKVQLNNNDTKSKSKMQQEKNQAIENKKSNLYLESQQLINSRQPSNQTNRTKKSENISIMNKVKGIQDNKGKTNEPSQMSGKKVSASQPNLNIKKCLNSGIDQNLNDKINQKSKLNISKPNTGSSKASNGKRSNKLKQTAKQQENIVRIDKSKLGNKKQQQNNINYKNLQNQNVMSQKMSKQIKNQKQTNKKQKEDIKNKQFSESDSDLENTAKNLNSEAPKQITCISKKSSFVSQSNKANINECPNKNTIQGNKSNRSLKSRKSDMKPIHIRQYSSIAIQMGEGNINVPIEHLNNKINVSVGTSVKEFVAVGDNLSKRQSIVKENSIKLANQQKRQVEKPPNKHTNQELNNNGLASEFVSFGNITCSPKMQPAQQQSFLNIQQDQKLNNTDFPPALPQKQRKLNRNNSQNHSKNRSHYIRAPILQYIYGDQKKRVQQQSFNFERSDELCPFQFSEQYQDDQNNDTIYKSIQIILDIDSWLIDRIFQPYSSIDGDHYIWLYCKGHWKLFHSNNTISASSFIRQALSKAILQQYGVKDPSKLGIQQIIRMITGLQVMQLKNKRKLSQQIDYHLKKGNVIKGLSSKLNNSSTYSITAMQTTANMEKLLQIKKIKKDIQDKANKQDENRIVWIKQQTFHKYFDYFLLICYRQESHWTCKQLINPQLMQTLVYTLDSLQNSTGSLELHSDCELSCKIDLYRQVKPKLLKFVGTLSEKNKPIRSTQNPNSSICFNFSIKGRYYLLINISQLTSSINTTIQFSLQCSEQVSMNYLESIQHQTYKNSTSEYIQVNSKSKGKNKSMHRQNKQKSMVKIKDKSILSQHTNKEDLREQFINYVIGKDDNNFLNAD